MVKLRHIVNHPYVIYHPLNDDGTELFDKNIMKVCGKLTMLDAILKKLKQNGHRVLIFSTFVIVIVVLQEYFLLEVISL